MGAITGALIKGAGVAIGSSASIVSGAVGGATGIIAKEAIAPRSTVSEAAEQKAIREAEARRKEKSNPNLDYVSSRQVIEKGQSAAGFTGGQESGVNYNVTMTANYASIYTPDQVFSHTQTIATDLPGAIGGIDVINYGFDRASVRIWYNNNKNYINETTDNVSTTTQIIPGSAKFSIARADGQPDNSGEPPPFYGGQVAGAQYVATCNWKANDDRGDISIGGRVVTGAITNIQCWVTQSGYWDTYYWVRIDFTDADGNPDYHGLRYHQSSSRDIDPNYWIEVKPYPDENTPYPGESNPPVADNNLYSETTSPLPIEPVPAEDLHKVSAPTAKKLAQKLAGLIREGKIDDALTTPEVRDELRKLIASNNAVSDKTNVVDNLDNSDGYATAYTQGYEDGFSALLERDKLNTQNKANNLDVAIPKPVTQTKEKQKPAAVTTAAKVATQKKAREPSTTTKYLTAGKTPIKETTVTDKGTNIKTITQEVADTGKVVSIKRVIPANTTTTKTGVSNEPIRTNNTATFKAIGTPSNTGVGVTPIPQVPTLEQEPAIPEVAGLGLTAAAVAAAVYSEQGIEKLTSAAAAGTCQTTQPGGCMQKNVVDPLKAGQTSLGELFNNVANTGLAAQNAAIQAIVQNTNDIVKHSTYGLEAIQNLAKNAWEATHMDKVINVMNLLMSTHNAAMLSRNLGETIAELGTNILSLFNIKNPATGESIDVGQTIGKTIQGAINTVVPEAIRTNISTTWIKLNRIHSAAVAMASAIRQSKDAVLEVHEVTADWIAQIGNSMQEQGIVEEDSYPWMRENNDFVNPYEGFLNKLNDIEEVVEQASSFVNAAIELKDSTVELVESGAELRNALNEFNHTKESEETTKETESTSPDIANSDLIKNEE